MRPSTIVTCAVSLPIIVVLATGIFTSHTSEIIKSIKCYYFKAIDKVGILKEYSREIQERLELLRENKEIRKKIKKYNRHLIFKHLAELISNF